MNRKDILSGSLSIIIHLLIIIWGSYVCIKKSRIGGSNFNSISIDTIEIRKSIGKEKEKEKVEPKPQTEQKTEKKVEKIIPKKTVSTKNIKKSVPIKKEKIHYPKDEKKVTKDNNAKESKPTKKIDSRALYRKGSNTNSGAILDMEGWKWDDTPVPHDDTEEVGKIVFEITVNNHGEIISIKTLERTVSVGVESIYRESLDGITFSRLKSYDKDPNKGSYTGKVTFFIKYK